MKINRFRLSELSDAQRDQIMRRSESDIADVLQTVQPIIEAVRRQGDAALVEYAQRFDKATLDPARLRVEDAEFAAAAASIDDSLREAIDYSIANIRKFHREQMPGPTWMTEIRPGVLAGEKVTPIASVGLYVPRGKGSFPSVMMMLGVPAVEAGVETVVVCTPPGADGSIDAATLYTARQIGLKHVVRTGGAQSIAALAYGTASVPRVRKVIGPGNQYVSAAKRLLYGQIDVGTPAGPSESIVLCDEHADPELAGRDLLIEAEHGPNSAALLVTHSQQLADRACEVIRQQLPQLPEQRRSFCETVLSGFGGVMLTDSLAQSIDFVNQYAPEHLEVLVENPFEVLGELKNAGEILLGPHTPITLGNFSIGVNAILPTGGFATTYSCVSVFDFLKRSSFGYVSQRGFDEISKHALRLADYEGFPTHAAALRYRRCQRGL